MTADDGTGDLGPLRDEIRRTRAELGETVQALAARADVKARVKQSAAQTKGRVRERAVHTADAVRTSVHDVGVKARRNAVPWGALAAGAGAVVIVFLVIRGRRR